MEARPYINCICQRARLRRSTLKNVHCAQSSGNISILVQPLCTRDQSAKWAPDEQLASLFALEIIFARDWLHDVIFSFFFSRPSRTFHRLRTLCHSENICCPTRDKTPIMIHRRYFYGFSNLKKLCENSFFHMEIFRFSLDH